MEHQVIEYFIFIQGRWHSLIIYLNDLDQGYDLLIPVSEGAD
jgi:hypothetical protein